MSYWEDVDPDGLFLAWFCDEVDLVEIPSLMGAWLYVARSISVRLQESRGWLTALNWTAAILMSVVFLVAGLWKITDPIGAAARLAQAKVARIAQCFHGDYARHGGDVHRRSAADPRVPALGLVARAPC